MILQHHWLLQGDLIEYTWKDQPPHLTKGNLYEVLFDQKDQYISVMGDNGIRRLSKRENFAVKPREEGKNRIAEWRLVKQQYRNAVRDVVGEMYNVAHFPDLCARAHSIWIEKLRKAGVLDLWFEPIFEKQRIKKELTIGNNDWKVIVSNKESITACGYNHRRRIYIDELEELYNVLIKDFPDCSLSDEPVRFDIPHALRCVKIGCEESNNLCSLGEIKSIIDTYKELNS